MKPKVDVSHESACNFTGALRRGKVDDVVEVNVPRYGEPVTAPVKLKQHK